MLLYQPTFLSNYLINKTQYLKQTTSFYVIKFIFNILIELYKNSFSQFLQVIYKLSIFTIIVMYKCYVNIAVIYKRKYKMRFSNKDLKTELFLRKVQ